MLSVSHPSSCVQLPADFDESYAATELERAYDAVNDDLRNSIDAAEKLLAATLPGITCLVVTQTKMFSVHGGHRKFTNHYTVAVGVEGKVNPLTGDAESIDAAVRQALARVPAVGAA